LFAVVSVTATVIVNKNILFMLTSLAVQFYLGLCSKSGMLATRLASC